jgi:SAM-dependent methyltransferase
MSRGGLQPFGEYFYSSAGHVFRNEPALAIPLPNLSGYLHNVLRQFMDCHGLGFKCLLVSESNSVKVELQKYYPNIDFVTCDYFPELMNASGQNKKVDIIWDVCTKTPDSLINDRFDSIICHAMLEHVIAPTMALMNLFSICAQNGKIYLLTCTPSFHHHQFPRDYVRFHHDFFQDMPAFLEKYAGIKSVMLEMYSHEGLVALCYQKQ